MVEVISYEELIKRCEAQRVSGAIHYAFRCVICGTIQSGATLKRAGATAEKASNMIGFSCEGRLTDAGPWPSDKDTSRKARARRQVRGCDWTLGGLFTLHKLAVDIPPERESDMTPSEGYRRPCFELATPEEAQELERWESTLDTPPPPMAA